MIREHESNMKNRAEITVSEGSALWTRALHDADARQNEAFRQFHDWFYGLMDPEEACEKFISVGLTMGIS